MTDAGRLAVVRTIHTLIYLVMTAATLVLLYAGVTGARGPWLWAALALLAVETVVFVAAGMKCPLTAVAVKYGAGQDGLFDTWLPERFTRHTLKIFAPLMTLGLALVAVRLLT